MADESVDVSPVFQLTERDIALGKLLRRFSRPIPQAVIRELGHRAKMSRKREARRAPAMDDPTLMNGARIDGMGRPFGGR